MNNKNISKVYLLNAPLENDYKHTLYFTNATSQHDFFKSKIVHTFDNVSYQRKDHKFRCPKHIDELWNCNYVMYQNSYYNNKWFYAFIKNMTYISDGVTEIEIQTDVMQTWAFDYNIKPSFVEREHVSDDTTGIHTYPESLETGDYIVNDVKKNATLTDCVTIVASTIDTAMQDGKHIGGNTGGGIYNGVRSGYGYFTFENNKESSLSNVLKVMAEDGKIDAIGFMFVAPRILVDVAENDTYDNAMVVESNTYKAFTWGDDIDTPITKPTSINGYTPRNKKLLTYPFSYMLMSNNNGGNAIYKYELFKGGIENECTFDIFGALTPGMDIILYPYNYNGSVGSNYSEGLPSGKYPICGWTSDVYTNWLTQNSINIATSMTGDIINTAVGIAGLTNPFTAGVGAMQMTSGLSGITNTIGEIVKHSFVPDQARGNVNTGNINFATNNTTYIAYHMSIKKEYAEIIDKYFDMFGYKVNMVKTPNKAHRSRYWFTKTIDINIDGAIPNDDLQIIKDVYNNGVTFWRNANEIQNYDLSNTIV